MSSSRRHAPTTHGAPWPSSDVPRHQYRAGSRRGGARTSSFTPGHPHERGRYSERPALDAHNAHPSSAGNRSGGGRSRRRPGSLDVWPGPRSTDGELPSAGACRGSWWTAGSLGRASVTAAITSGTSPRSRKTAATTATSVCADQAGSTPDGIPASSWALDEQSTGRAPGTRSVSAHSPMPSPALVAVRRSSSNSGCHSRCSV